MTDLIPLKLLPAGATGRIAQLLGSSHEVHRLEELGLRPGTAVEVVQAGSPCIIRLSGHKLCFRESDLFSVLVDVGDKP